MTLRSSSEGELNSDKVGFTKYATAVKYCAFSEHELSHLSEPTVTQNRIVYRVGGHVTRTKPGIADHGVVVLYYWPDYSRITTVYEQKERKNVRNDGKSGQSDTGKVDDDVKRLVVCAGTKENSSVEKGVWSEDLLKVANENLDDPAITWEFVTASWKRVKGNDDGHVQFSFAIMVFGDKYPFQKVLCFMTNAVIKDK